MTEKFRPGVGTTLRTTGWLTGACVCGVSKGKDYTLTWVLKGKELRFTHNPICIWKRLLPDWFLSHSTSAYIFPSFFIPFSNSTTDNAWAQVIHFVNEDLNKTVDWNQSTCEVRFPCQGLVIRSIRQASIFVQPPKYISKCVKNYSSIGCQHFGWEQVQSQMNCEQSFMK